MFIRIKGAKMDIIKNADRIDAIYKSKVQEPMTAEDLMKNIEKWHPTIKIKWTEEIEGKLGQEIIFSSEAERDAEFEKMSSQLDARIFGSENK